jgi:ABC-type glycerol-3-phosphate transport system substrate-binding protein
MRTKSSVTRRTALKLGAAATALPLVHIRTAGAAGKVSIVFYDAWVPAGNVAIKKQCDAWAEKNKVEVQADFLSTANNQIIITENAEAQAGAGHDAFSFATWEAPSHTDYLEPMDDVMARLTAKIGQPNATAEYLAKKDGHWMAVPTSSGAQVKGPVGRISILKDAAGLDMVKMFPGSGNTSPGLDAWTWDTFLKGAEACAKVGKPFGIGLGTTGDSSDTAGCLFASFGAELINAKGEITVRSDAVRQVLEYAQRLVKFLPTNAVGYDDASNNRALISNQSALIFNPPSAWAVAVRDAPQVAADCWHFPPPAGPKGRFAPVAAYFWGVWKFARNKSAAKELIEFLAQREQSEERCNATMGYDMPPYPSMMDFKVWETAEPPKGVLYNYPMRPWHKVAPLVSGSPAPPEIGVQIYNRGTMPTMMAKLLNGQSINDVMAWAEDELVGFKRG